MLSLSDTFEKLGRKYSLIISSPTGPDIVIELPFTIEFDIIRNSYASANICSIKIYNLSEQTREAIRKDRWAASVFRDISLLAGYGNKVSVIFSGNVTQAWSVREGSNFITQIESFDGGYPFANSIANMEFPKDTSYNTIIRSMIGKLTTIKAVGQLSNFPGSIPRGNSYNGSVTQLLDEITGKAFFIDCGIANILLDDEYLKDDPIIIDSDMGLLSTPLVQEQYLSFDILFEPSVKVGQRLQLKSRNNKFYNSSKYKIVAVKHRGVISEVVSGEAKTTIEVFAYAGENAGVGIFLG